jgi:hypothetical protein
LDGLVEERWKLADYFGVRGWVESKIDDGHRVTSVIENFRQRHRDDASRLLYLSGWCWIPVRFNWTAYLHYGGDVQAHGLILLREVLQDIAALGCCSGFFYVDGDDGSKSAYVLKNSTLSVRELPGTIADLVCAIET